MFGVLCVRSVTEATEASCADTVTNEPTAKLAPVGVAHPSANWESLQIINPPVRHDDNAIPIEPSDAARRVSRLYP